MAKNFEPLKVKEIRDETADAVCVTFDIPDALKTVYEFKPGQYLTLRKTIDGEEVRRSYSICAAQGSQPRVGIKRVEGGRFSNFARTLKAGDEVEVFPPAGRFTPDENPEGNGDVLLVAAGSGITPVLSVAQSLLEQNQSTKVTLIYGNRNSSSIMFKGELEDLKDRYVDRFYVFHVLSQEQQDVALFNGRIEPELIKKLEDAGLISLKNLDAIFVCGPSGMNEQVVDVLTSLNIDPAIIKTEFFKQPVNGARNAPKKVTVNAPQNAEAEIVLDGSKYRVSFEDPTDTVLSAAGKAGVELPFSCRGGMCATCRCKLLEGEVEMEKNYALADWEIKAGFVLGCQSRPKTTKIVLDFDAV